MDFIYFAITAPFKVIHWFLTLPLGAGIAVILIIAILSIVAKHIH